MTDLMYEKIVRLVNAGLIVLKEDAKVVCWNEWMTKRSGIEESHIQSKSIYDVVPEISGSRIERAIKKALEFNCPSVLSAKLIDASFPLYKDVITGKRDPDRIIQSILIKPFKSPQGGQHCVISIYDISSADLRERALRNQSKMLTQLVKELKEKDYEIQTIFNNTQNAIIVFDTDGMILNANTSAREIVTLDERDIGYKKIYDIIEDFEPELFQHSNAEERIKNFIPDQDSEREMLAINSHGIKIPISLSANVIPYENKDSRFFVFFRDITEKKRAEERLNYMARFDTLTNLPNRASFTESVNRAIALHQRKEGQFSVFFIDIDDFKNVNDSYGHNNGDAVLFNLARRLERCCRSSDTIARWAGDEFVLLTEHTDRKESAIIVAEKIVAALSEPLKVQTQEVILSCSIGIAQYPEDGKDTQTLITNADQAMYQAKNEGKGQFRFFTPEMNQRMRARLRMESDLRAALKNNEFRLHFQPQVSIKSGELVGVEALIRWEHPTRGSIMPDEFIPFSEESGLIAQIGDWVLLNSLETASQWQKREGWKLPISINLSGRQFNDNNLVSKVKKLIDSVGVPADSVILEITENYLMGEDQKSLVMLNALKALGVKIAIDDFGTGYSSLAYLRKLPVDILKIDQGFLVDACSNSVSAHIVAAVIDLAHALDLEVVAEGIEQNDQLELLRTQGCDTAQGFYLGLPMDLEKLKEWIKSLSPAKGSAH
jgi:diguanylate cyclase (GGDEF)-like protein/PAS domain S-box-containing protein